MTRPILALAALALSGCQLTLPALLGLAPTPAEICGMSPATQVALAKTLGVTLETLTAACEIVG